MSRENQKPVGPGLPSPERSNHQETRDFQIGACMALRGFDQTLPFLITDTLSAERTRRELLGHFRQPSAVNPIPNGGGKALFASSERLDASTAALVERFHPDMLGLICPEQSGSEEATRKVVEDIQMTTGCQVAEIRNESPGLGLREGFHLATRNVMAACAAAPRQSRSQEKPIILFAGPLSPADLRHLKEIFGHFGLPCLLCPDYSVTLDGPAVAAYEPVLSGGTSLEALGSVMGQARLSLTLASGLCDSYHPGIWLRDTCGVESRSLGVPIGLRETDALFEVLRELSGRATPEKHDNERQRLADAYVEAHKYLAGLRVAVYGEEDFVVALASFVSEVGAVPVICASPGRSGHLRSRIKHHLRKYDKDMTVLQNASIESFEAAVCRTKIDLLLAGSQVSAIARRHHIPHVRVGFPILDRVGGQRMLHIGYLGTLRLFDAMVNALIGHNEENAETDSR